LEETFNTNFYGTYHVLEAVHKTSLLHPFYKKRIFVVGSSEEYGALSEESLPVTETSSFNPTNPYGTSKLASYFLCKQYFSAYGLDVVYLCPFSHFGPGQKEGFLISDICKQIVEIERGQRESKNNKVMQSYLGMLSHAKTHKLREFVKELILR
jgi:GDP-4-dehydro-6-deoxy-D-mannose reductase